MPEADQPGQTLSVADDVAITVGMVVGVGIFKTPTVAAVNAQSGGMDLIFWLFFLIVGISVFVMRHRSGHVHFPFKTPLYRLTPLVFCGICVFMLHASLAYTGRGALPGLCLMLTGLPLMALQKKRRPTPGCHVRAAEQ